MVEPIDFVFHDEENHCLKTISILYIWPLDIDCNFALARMPLTKNVWLAKCFICESFQWEGDELFVNSECVVYKKYICLIMWIPNISIFIY